MKKFLDCISVVGTTPSRFQGTKKYVSTGAVATTEIVGSEVVEVTYEDRPSRANLTAEAGDILFAKMQGTRKTLLLDSETEDNIYSTGFYAVRANPDVITTECLYYLVDSELFLAQKDKNCSGATQKAITNGGLAKIEISVPPLSEQSILTEKLRYLTQLIADKRKQLELFDEVIKSRFIEMFGDKGYPKLKWNEVFSTTTGKLDSNAMVADGEYPFFTCAKEVFRIDKYAFDQEALLLAGNNAAGKYDVKYYKGKFNAYQRTYVLGLKQNWSYQLFRYQLEDKLDYLQQQSLGGLTKYLTIKILGELEFIVPPMDKQDEFTAFVEQTDKSKFEIQKSLEKLEILKKSLMQQYFG